MPETDKTAVAIFAEGLQDLAEALSAVVEMAQGHRNKLEQAGFSETAAEQGAALLHAEFIHMLFASLGNATTKAT